MYYSVERGNLHRKRHHRPRGPRAGSPPAGHVHRRRRIDRAASPRLGNRRQLRRRGDERPRVEHRRHAAQGRVVDHGRRRRPRDSGRQAPADEDERARGRSSRRSTPAASSKGSNYKTAGGLHGVGASVVNALSRELVATVKRDGSTWEQKYKQGEPVGGVKKLGAGARHGHDGVLPARPDDLSESRSSTRAVIRERLEVASYLHKGLKVTFENEAAEGGAAEARGLRARAKGIADYLKKILAERNAKPVHDAPFTLTREHDESGLRARPRAAVDRVDRRAPAQLRQRHPDGLRRHARERPARAGSARRSATSSTRTTSRRRASRSRPRTSARASSACSASSSRSRSSRARRRIG